MKNLLHTVILILSAMLAQQSRTYAQHTPITPAYQVFGHGHPILIINGGPGMNSNGFADVAQKIAELGYQTILFDQRGTGGSVLDTLSPKTITMDLLASDMERLRNELGLEKWTLLGHSFGGLLACHYLAKYPHRVEKLIFSSSGGVNLGFMRYVNNRIQQNLTPIQRDSLRFYLNLMAGGDTTALTRRRRAEFLAPAYVYHPQHANRIANRLLEVNLPVNSLVFQDLVRINFDYTGYFVNSATPVLVIQGKNDIISVETAQEIVRSFKYAQLTVIDQCAHYGWLDQPQHYFTAIQQFLGS